MSSIVCAKCGGLTNTAVAMWLPTRADFRAHWCYAKVEDGMWVKGCCLNLAPPSMRGYVTDLIGTTAEMQNIVEDFADLLIPDIEVVEDDEIEIIIDVKGEWDG